MSTTDKLKAAAEELVKAAQLDSNAETNKETIDAITMGTDSLKGLETHLVALKSSIDAKANTVDQNMENLKDALAKVDTKLTELKRSQLLAHLKSESRHYTGFQYQSVHNCTD
jgi:chromosome segregation ATPase